MHNMTVRDWSINHNGDFSGNVEFIAPTGEHYGIPFEVLLWVVAQFVRQEKMNALESALPETVLGVDPRF
jgi:hypothetical protein